MYNAFLKVKGYGSAVTFREFLTEDDYCDIRREAIYGK
jgi:hypothetical protein